jgi:alkanesulfonate monooxygenase SsuD/methylene tetrahydromethanopterin reductase-like flavin-dependent oxidoreductase (luciferase family)
MRFGLPGTRGNLAPGSAVSTLDLARTAEALGYDSLWLSEEHFSQVGAVVRRRPPSTLVAAAAIAAATRRIRIGFSVLLPQIHDAGSLAEDIATLDILSGGRVNLGLGWPNPVYLEAFPRPAVTLAEQLATMTAAWAGEPVIAGTGAYIVEPPPHQQPHPPIHIAPCDQAAVDWAAAQSYAIILSAFQASASLHDTLSRFADQGGRLADSPIERFCMVAESDQAARQQAWPLVQALVQRLTNSGTASLANAIIAEHETDPHRFYDEVALIGSAETVAARITALRDRCGVHAISLRPSFWGSCPAELQRETVARFAADVMPKFA